MGVSTDTYLKSFVFLVLASMGFISYLILSPDPDTHPIAIKTTQQFGQFIEKNADSMNLNYVKRSPAKSPDSIIHSATTNNLGPEENELLQKDLREWAQTNLVRDQLWRSQIEDLLSVVEKNKSTTLLDYLKPQIVNGRYDVDESNRVSAKIWAERYLKIEQREYQRNQIQDLLTD